MTKRDRCTRVALSLLWCLLFGGSSEAFVSPRNNYAAFQKRSSAAPTLVSSCRMSLKPLHDDLCGSVTERLGLKRTDFTETFQAQSWTGPTASGTADWWAEASPQYLTGVTVAARTNQMIGNAAEELTLNIWMGPSYDVPHMLLAFGQDSQAGYYVTADYVPRGGTVMGGDPQYLQAYYGPDVQASWTQAYSAAAATPLPPAAEFDLRLLQSPIYLSVTGLSPSAAEDLIRSHVDRFLNWLSSAPAVPARLRGSFNLRDDKLRQFFYKGQVQRQVATLGDELGRIVAAANTGPTAEAYVGGGS